MKPIKASNARSATFGVPTRCQRPPTNAASAAVGANNVTLAGIIRPLRPARNGRRPNITRPKRYCVVSGFIGRILAAWAAAGKRK
jgi:hypothetical protein